MDVGSIVGGTYRIERRLGSGGMGAVYAAVHLRTKRRYALKVLLPEVAARRDAVARFRREAEAVGALGHANVVGIHDFDEADGVAFLAMDLLEGEDLATRLERRRALPLEEALAIVTEVGAGLEAAHARLLVHRDLKPANVFLARQPGLPERAIILDFGLAKSFVDDGDTSRLTQSGVVMGTPLYMSPEQASGTAVDARADLYSLATMFYEMLAGRPPFAAPTLPALFAKLLSDPAPPLSLHRPDLPEGLSEVVARALAKAPADRFADVPAFIAELRAAALPATAAHPASAPPPPIDPFSATVATPASSPRAATPAASAAHRTVKPLVVLGLVATLVLGAGALALVAMQTRDEPDEPPLQISSAVPIVVEPARQEPAPIEPVPVEIERVVAEPVAPPPSKIRRASRPAPTDPAPGDPTPADPLPAAPPDPSAPPAGPPPRDAVVEATEHMGRQDYAGCLRVLRGAPRSPRVLSTRMSCAMFGNDNQELRSACTELRAHYPEQQYTRTCEEQLRLRGL